MRRWSSFGRPRPGLVRRQQRLQTAPLRVRQIASSHPSNMGSRIQNVRRLQTRLSRLVEGAFRITWFVEGVELRLPKAVAVRHDRSGGCEILGRLALRTCFEWLQCAAAWTGNGLSKASTPDRVAANAIGGGRDVEASGTVAQRPAPVRASAEAAFHHPAAIEHDEAFCPGSRWTARRRMPCPFDQALQRSATKPPSGTASRSLGHSALPPPTRATRLRPGGFLAASCPRGPRTGMRLTDCVSLMLRLSPGLRPAAWRRKQATSHRSRSKPPSASHLRNQPYTVRHAGQSAGEARQGPPTRTCQAIALTTGNTGVARPLRDGLARSSHRALSSTARLDAIRFGPLQRRCQGKRYLVP